MALRELFATFGFDWDKPALAQLDRAVDKIDNAVESVARHFDEAAADARRMGAEGKRAARDLASGERALGSWGEKARAANVPLGALRARMTALHAAVRRAAAGDRELADAFGELGVDVDRVARSGRNASSVWNEMVGRLSRMTDAANRARLATRLLGAEGAKAAAGDLARGPAGIRVQRRLAAAPRTVSAAPALDATAQSATRLQRILSGLRRAFTRTDRSARDAAEGVERVDRATDRASKRSITGGILAASFWQGLATRIVHAEIALVRFAARGVGALFGEVGRITVWTDSVEKALGMISGMGLQRGMAEFREAARTAGTLALDVETSVEAFKKLRAVGFDREQAVNLVKLTADMKAGLGLTDETIGRVQLAIGQIKGAGRLQGDELRQLQETGLNVDAMWRSIAEQMGVTVQEAMKLKEQGKVSADVALQGIQASVLSTLGTSAPGEAAAKLASTTFRGMMGQARGAAQLWFVDLGKAVAPGMDRIAQLIMGTFRDMQADGTLDKLLTNIQRLVLDTIDLIEVHWPRIDKVIKRVAGTSGDEIGSLVMQLDGLIEKTLDLAEFVLDNWGEIKTAIVTATGAIVLAVTAIGAASVVDAIRTVTGLFRGQATAAGAAATQVETAGAAATTAAGRMRGLGGAINAIPKSVAITVALVGVAAAYQQLQALRAESKGEGGVVEATSKAGLWEGFANAGTMGIGGGFGRKAPGLVPQYTSRYEQLQNERDVGALLYGVPQVAPPTAFSLPEIAPMQTPAAGYSRRTEVTLNDQRRTEISVSGMARPAEVARQVQTATERQATLDADALLGGLAGATDG